MPLKSKKDKNIRVLHQHLVQSSSERLPCQQMGVGAVTYPDIIWREKSKLEVSSDPSRAQGTPQKMGRKDYRNQRTWRTPGEHRPPNQLSGAHMDSQRLKQRACQGLYQVLCAYIVAVRMMDLWNS